MSDTNAPAPEVPVDTKADPLPRAIQEETESSIPDTPERAESFDQVLARYERENERRPVSDDGARSNQINGTVVSITVDAVLVDIGYKTEGTLPLSFFTGKGEVPSVGDRVLVTSKGRNEDGYYDLSLHKVAQPRDISSLERAFAAGTTIPGTVTAIVKGGLTVDIGVRAFMPGSLSGARDAADLEKLVGTEILCRIIKLEKEEGDEPVDIVVDRRVVIDEESRIAKDRLYSELCEGNVVSGTVRSLVDYGAFVDIAGVDGLLHISDIAWSRVASPSDVLTIGQQIEVKILKIDPATKKIGLGMKQLLPHPWDSVQSTYSVGERIRGAVTRLTDFGAFIGLTPGVEGMIHVSEMSWAKKVRKPEDMLKIGDVVEAMILGIDTAAQRIALSLKQTLGDPWAEVPSRFLVGAIAIGPISSLTKFGAFVTLADGIEGLVHVSEISPDKRIERPQDVLRTGQIIQAKILDVDASKRQIRLSIKQLVPTGHDEYFAERKVGDVVTARILSMEKGCAVVELGQDIYASCEITSAEAEPREEDRGVGSDLSALTSMLSAKWKGASTKQSNISAPPEVGQVRNFRIIRMMPEQKKIDVELLLLR